MIKWSFGDGTLVTEILFIEITEIPDNAQITLNWYTYFLKLILNEEPNDYFTLETNTYKNFLVCVCC